MPASSASFCSSKREQFRIRFQHDVLGFYQKYRHCFFCAAPGTLGQAEALSNRFWQRAELYTDVALERENMPPKQMQDLDKE
jgi:hypothetical protein